MSKSIAWHMGFCDKFYKDKPRSGYPNWMDEKEKREYIRGWNTANRL